MNKYYFSSFNNIDNNREMGISKNHLEFIANTNTVHHISNNASYSSEKSISFLLLEPHSKLDSLFSIFLKLVFSKLKWNMLEGFGNLSEGT